MSPRISSENTPTVMVLSSAGETKTSAYRNSFQDSVKANCAAQITPGTATGSRIRTSVCRRLQPSSMARSEERRVGKECRAGGAASEEKKKGKKDVRE